ncbi:phosphatidylserine/phosphatidylglycerophosphate/cardiolipin synthase-like enzyme [Xanthobacter flavus]|uniref:Phosphatidylserine/phosphatidylglycerophosphate/ cardiolipin synthase-like enzyme n=1 Tax=Xanthobacter flavus TaxID=281 RepID=A0A9W6FPL6_XANFL|nr:hypothetical protein [Xanthobacter flavus]MDR6331907.1 phosphatidylserine/phosphatidylglycerophosphate/cardiolipin synthase-like enzyme [Xanthobacter flavus]GLI25682.1 hypothetical protein XFLAVUS301_53560 [Xanthobacter flavus]
MNDERAATTFADLDPKVQSFLGRLDDADVSLLEKGIDLMRHVASAGRVAKWCIIVVVSLIVGLSALGDAIAKIFHWFVTK